MSGSLLVGLTQNTLLLLAGAFVLDLVAHRRWPGLNTFPPVPFGLTLGVLGIAVMSFPGTFSSGISCYTPSILLFLAGLFFGFKPTAMAVATVAAFRLYLSGIHDGVGLTAILLPAALGIAWRSARRRPLERMAWWELYLSGAGVHLLQLAPEQMLPGKAALPVLADVVVAHLLICPLGTLLLGLLLISRLRRDKHIATRLEGERRYWDFFESNRAVMLISDPDTGAIVDANPAAAAYYGWGRDVLKGKRINEISEPQPPDRKSVV